MEYTKCSLCSKAFDRDAHIPRILPQCGHSFCDVCVRNKISTGKRNINCPIDKQTHVLAKEGIELPINRAIYDAIISKAKSPDRAMLNKYTFGTLKDEISMEAQVCQRHNKVVQYHCKTDGQNICVDCLLFTFHKNHEFHKISPSTESQEDSYGQLRTISNQASPKPTSQRIPTEKISMLVKQILQKPNCLDRAIGKMKNQLKEQINRTFALYYDRIKQQESRAYAQMDELVCLCEGQMLHIRTKLTQYLKQSQQLMAKANQTRNTNNFKVVERLVEEFDRFGAMIVEEDREVQDFVDVYTENFKKQLGKIDVFRNVNLMTEVTFKNLPVTTAKQPEELSRTCRNGRSYSESTKKKIPYQPILATTKRSLVKGNSKNKQNQLNQAKDGIFYGLEILNDYKKHRKVELTPCRRYSPSNSFSKDRSRSKGQKNKSRQKSPQNKFINRQKIEKIIEILQKQRPPILELIGLDIEDFYLPKIIQATVNSGEKYGVIKLVRNRITDEGLKILLKGLRNYPYVHSLNLTSNCLTQESLCIIADSRVRNKTLTNFYLSGNNISGSKSKGKKQIMFDYGINVFL